MTKYRAKSDAEFVIEPKFHNIGSKMEFVSWKSLHELGVSSLSGKEFATLFEEVPDPLPIGTQVVYRGDSPDEYTVFSKIQGDLWSAVGNSGMSYHVFRDRDFISRPGEYLIIRPTDDLQYQSWKGDIND